MASTIAPVALTNAPATDKLRQQAVELEGVFLNTLMKEMFSSLKSESSEFGGGFAEETWRGMQAEQFASAMAEAGGVGLADALMPDLIALQESAQNNPAPPLNGAYR